MEEQTNSWFLAQRYKGWYSTCVRSPLRDPRVIPEELIVEGNGWVKCGNVDRDCPREGYEYGLLLTSATKGFKNVAAKEYYSVVRRKQNVQ